MAQTPYGDIVADFSRRVKRDTRSSSDVQGIMDEIDWYRKLIETDIMAIEKQPGLEPSEKRSKQAKLERNKDALAQIRLEAMELKKEWLKSEQR